MVYVDSVFVLNALMDYLLVLCAARLAGIPLRRRRYLLGGPAGGPPMPWRYFLPGAWALLSATPVQGWAVQAYCWRWRPMEERQSCCG